MAFIGLLEFVVIVFILLPLILAIKFPAFRIFLGALMVIIGLFEILVLGWLFGIGWIIGLPTIFLGLLFIALGWSCKKEIIIQEKVVPQPPGKVLFCRYCGEPNPSDSSFCQKCGRSMK